MTRYVVVARDLQTVVGPFPNYTLAQRWAEVHRTHLGQMPGGRPYTGWIIKQLRRPETAVTVPEAPGVI